MTDAATCTDPIADLRYEVQAAGAAFCSAVAALEPLADRLVRADAQLRVAEHRAGDFNQRADVRALAVEILTGRLQALSPRRRPMTTRRSADEAAELLSATPPA